MHERPPVKRIEESEDMKPIETLMAQFNALQREIEHMRAHETQRIVEQVLAVLRAHGVTYNDVVRYGEATAPATAKKKVAPKYWNPETGETWSGRGRSPLWIAGETDRSRFMLPVESTESSGPSPYEANRGTGDPDDAATGTGGEG